MNEWRKSIATLAIDKSRLALAEAILAEAQEQGRSLSDAERSRAKSALTKAGLISPDGRVNPSHFEELLAADDGTATREGLDRFLIDGKIDRYPANQRQRQELLEWVGGHALQPGEVLSEPALNERLQKFTSDFAALRRYLVDAEILERTPSGTEYSLRQARAR